jgi:hypothetical protein
MDNNYYFYKPYLYAMLLDPRLNLVTIQDRLNLQARTRIRLLEDLQKEYNS